MNQKTLITVLVVAVVILAGITVCLALNKNISLFIANQAKTSGKSTANLDSSAQYLGAKEKTPSTKIAATGWQLVSGNAEDTCSTPIYKGEAKIKGWYVWDYNYVEKTWMLEIAEEDIDKLPIKEAYGEETFALWKKNANYIFRLTDAETQLERKLKSASKTKPIEITVRGFKAYCEGAPLVSINGF